MGQTSNDRQRLRQYFLRVGDGVSGFVRSLSLLPGVKLSVQSIKKPSPEARLLVVSYLCIKQNRCPR